MTHGVHALSFLRMCLVVLGVRVHPRFPLIVLSNRDEVYARPTAAAHSWDDAPIFGGRDLDKAGTWLGLARARPTLPFGLVTNVRAPWARKEGRSRGELVRRALTEDFARIERNLYPSFNLLFGDADGVFCADESDAPPEQLAQGIHGLSNARIDVPWPKVRRLETFLEGAMEASDTMFDIDRAVAALRDNAQAAVQDLPDTGVGSALELALSAPFLALPGYGTRASTVLVYHRDGSVHFVEQAYGEGGSPTTRVDVQLTPT